jgi:hypothetical protein
VDVGHMALNIGLVQAAGSADVARRRYILHNLHMLHSFYRFATSAPHRIHYTLQVQVYGDKCFFFSLFLKGTLIPELKSLGF